MLKMKKVLIDVVLLLAALRVLDKDLQMRLAYRIDIAYNFTGVKLQSAWQSALFSVHQIHCRCFSEQ